MENLAIKNGMTENDVCSSDFSDGRVYSCEHPVASSPEHLVVMVHGILGSAEDWKFAAELFVKMLHDEVFVYCSERNASKLTLDGVDVMGERLANEVLEVIQRNPNLRKISFVAHSVGGLVARYAIGRLYRPSKEHSTEETICQEDSRSSIGGLDPMNFITVATPHLGSVWNKQVPFLFGVPAFEKVASYVIHLIFKRTGEHLFLTDSSPPLLKRMASNHGDCYFMSALGSFRRRVAYSNVGYDHIVGWRTSSIRRDSELPKWNDHVDEKYPHVVYEEHCQACDSVLCDDVAATQEYDSFEQVEEELLIALSRFSWEKVDVSFHTSKQRFAAHSVIQVKDQISHVDGVDVIQHIIDHFLV